MLTEEQMRDALRQCPHDTVENLRVRWLYAKDFARAIESAATAPLLARIAELEAQNNLLHRLMVSGEWRGVEKGLEESSTRIAELERQMDVMAKNTEAQAHASVMREIELTEKAKKLEQQLAEASKAMELARSWIAERPDLRQCSAGKVVSELTLALAIKEQT